MTAAETTTRTEELLANAADRVHLVCYPAQRTLCGLPIPPDDDAHTHADVDCPTCQLADTDPACPFSGKRCRCWIAVYA